MAAASKNSFGARDTLKAGSQSYEVYRLDALERGHRPRQPASLLHSHAAGKPAAPGRRPLRARQGYRGAGGMAAGHGQARGNRLHARARAAAGFHRRARRGRPGGHARRHRPHGRRRQEDQSPAPRRAGDRPFRAGGQVRQRHGLRLQRRNRVPAQRRALPIPALGTKGLSQFPGGAARHGHRATR